MGGGGAVGTSELECASYALEGGEAVKGPDMDDYKFLQECRQLIGEMVSLVGQTSPDTMMRRLRLRRGQLVGEMSYVENRGIYCLEIWRGDDAQ